MPLPAQSRLSHGRLVQELLGAAEAPPSSNVGCSRMSRSLAPGSLIAAAEGSSQAPGTAYWATPQPVLPLPPLHRHAFGSPHTMDYCGIGGSAATVDNCELSCGRFASGWLDGSVWSAGCLENGLLMRG